MGVHNLSLASRTFQGSKMTQQYGAKMKYPYTLAGKMLAFPWKYYWTHGRAIRFLTYSLILSTPLVYKINQLLMSDANKEVWRVKRAARLHDRFASPHE